MNPYREWLRPIMGKRLTWAEWQDHCALVFQEHVQELPEGYDHTDYMAFCYRLGWVDYQYGDKVLVKRG